MDNGFRKIGVIDYQKSKYANLFIIGSFVLSISVGAIRMFMLYNYSRKCSFDIYEDFFQRASVSFA